MFQRFQSLRGNDKNKYLFSIYIKGPASGRKRKYLVPV